MARLPSAAPLALRVLAIALGGLLTAWLTVSIPQISGAVGFVVLLGIGYRHSRRAALCCLWMLWLLMPFIRRLFGLVGPLPAYDPLSVLPFVATLVVSLIELARVPIGTRLARILMLSSVGLALGVPAAETRYAATTLFGLLAYGSALAAIIIGYSEQRTRQGPSSLVTVMLKAGPALAVYALYQYFFSLPLWDANWLDTVQLESVWSPLSGHIRVFGTLNAPGTFAAVMAIAILVWVSEQQLTARRFLALSCLLVALALTFVRSAWLAVAVGVIVYLVAARGHATPRVLLVSSLAVLSAAYLAESSQTVEALMLRFTSVFALDTDVSAQGRLQLLRTVTPRALAAPFGYGLGQAGVATKLGGETVLDSADNGYLALLFQVGPVGFLLVLGEMLWVVILAARGTFLGGQQARVAGLALALLVVLLVLEVFGDMMYGITGVAFWYVAGQAVAIVEPRTRTVKLAAWAPSSEGLAPGYS